MAFIEFKIGSVYFCVVRQKDCWSGVILLWPNSNTIVGLNGDMKSSERMTFLLDHNICNGVNLMDKCSHGFSAGKLSVASCQCQLLAKPGFFNVNVYKC